jgi:histidinol-phosphate aminotransferase
VLALSAYPFIRPEIEQLQGYVPGEQPRGAGVVKLNTNENPYGPSPRVLTAIREAATDALRLYPDPAATSLRSAASARYGLPPACILAGNGSDELLGLVMRACVGPGDCVAYARPTYSLYATLVAAQGGHAREVAFPADYTLPVEELAQSGPRVTLVCNPNAPSGTLFSRSSIEALAQRIDGLLVVDEAYIDFAGANESALPLVGKNPRVLVLRTFSKSFSLCAMRVGLAFGHPDIIAQLAKVKDSYNVGKLAQVAATAALEDYSWMETQAARVRASRIALAQALERRGFDVLPSETNFVLARLPGRAAEPVQKALKERNILVRFFDTPELLDSLRITVGRPDEIEALLGALDAVLEIDGHLR